MREYKFFKTAKKTAKENNFILGEDKSMFDFSLLDSMEISEWEKEVIRRYGMKVTPSNRVMFYGGNFDNFSACDGRAIYGAKKVYDKQCKFLYHIFMLVQVKHVTKKRDSIFDLWALKECYADCGSSEIEEIEIA